MKKVLMLLAVGVLAFGACAESQMRLTDVFYSVEFSSGYRMMVNMDSYRWLGAHLYASRYSMAIAVEGVKPGEAVTPILTPGTVKSFGKVEVWSDQKLYDQFLKEWDEGKVEWDGWMAPDVILYEGYKGIEYEVDMRAWPDGVREDRVWILFKPSIGASEWGGLKTFKLGIKETGEVREYGSTPLFIPDLYSWCNPKQFFNRVSLKSNGEDDFGVYAYADGGEPRHVFPITISRITVPGPGRLVIRGLDTHFDFDVWDDDVSVDHDWWYADTGMGFEAIEHSVTVDGKVDLLINGGWLGSDDWFAPTTIQFYPAGVKSVGISAAMAELDETGLSGSGAVLYGIVTGTGTFKVGEKVSLKAVSGGSKFDRWEVVSGELPEGVDMTKQTLSFTVPEDMCGMPEEAKHVVVRALWKKNYTLSLNALPLEGGVATGSGSYLSGNKVTLKATPKKGFVFAGWYEDDTFETPLVGASDYRTPSFAYTMPEDNANVYARFVRAEEDSEIALRVNGVEVGSDPAASVFYVADCLPLALDVQSITVPKVSVSGLPAGLKFTAKQVLNKDKSVLAEPNTIYGTATKPGHYVVTVKLTNNTVKKAIEKKFTLVVDNLTAANDDFQAALANARGEVYALSAGVRDLSCLPNLTLKSSSAKLSVAGLPSGLKYNAKTRAIEGVATKAGTYTVYLTVTEGRTKRISTLTLDVAALPTWLVGSYEGFGEYREEAASEDGGAIMGTLAVSSTGKLTGKFSLDIGLGRSNPSGSCSLAALDRVEKRGDGSVWYYATITTTFTIQRVKTTVSRELKLSAQTVGDMLAGHVEVYGSAYDDGREISLDLNQNLYARKDFTSPLKTTITLSATYEDNQSITAKISPKGAVDLVLGEKKGTVKAKGKLIITGYDAETATYQADTTFRLSDGRVGTVGFLLKTDGQGHIVQEGSLIAGDEPEPELQ